MARCCIIYISDQGYMFPTLVSAIQARGHASDATDVLIFHLGLDAPAALVFGEVCRHHRIRLLPIAPAVIEQSDAMMSRLFLDRFVPPEYDQFLYIDGDVHVSASLDPLIKAEVPAGLLMAANDPLTFLLGDGSAQASDLSNYMESIGIGSAAAAGYFNTGVLRISRDGWDAIGMRAWSLVRARGREFRFPDQDPLNLAALGCRAPMSLAWNFPVFMLNARVASAIRPRLVHFMSQPKPWHGGFQPWGHAAHAPYRQVLRAHPALAGYRSTLSPRVRARYHLQQIYKKAVETRRWGYSDKRDRILAYEAQFSASPLPSRPSDSVPLYARPVSTP